MHPLMERAWRALPRSIQDGIATGVDRARGATYDPPPLPPPTPYRVFFGPVNYAGQATRWSRALEHNSDVMSRSMVSSENNPFHYPVDYTVRWRTMEHDRRWQREMLEALTNHYTHVVFEAVMPVLGGYQGGDVIRQIQALRDRGLQVAILGHGTDVRLPSRHRSLEPWSHYRDDEWTPFESAERATQRNLDIITAAEVPTFVSTPGLLLDLPEAHLVPIVIDADRWPVRADPLVRRVPRVLHSPSNPITKGTHLIMPAIRRLENEGLIEFVRIEGLTNEQVRSEFSQGDILLDQFRAGDYGVAAVEAMSAGLLVVSHVSEQARAIVRDTAGQPLPILEATADNLEEVLRDVLARRDIHRALADCGPTFARAVHDGTTARSVLETHLLQIRR